MKRVIKNMMCDDIVNDSIKIFKIFKKLPSENMSEIDLFLTPENILGYHIHNNEEALTEFKYIIQSFKTLPNNEIYTAYKQDSYFLYSPTATSINIKMYERLINQVREYLKLRPSMIDKFPECLI